MASRPSDSPASPPAASKLSESVVGDLLSSASAEIIAAHESKTLEEVRLRYLGKKGELSVLLKGLGSCTPDERRVLGAVLNQARETLEQRLAEKKAQLQQATLDQKLAAEWIDVTLPVSAPMRIAEAGSLHPLTRIQQDLVKIFEGLGFTVVDGPEVELEYYNFEALNIPDTHPARDMQDTFWTVGGGLLRTHTSAVQVRALERMDPPLRIVVPGRCFRCERSDSSHDHTFYQMEGMLVDRHVNVGHLIYFMRTLLREIFGFEPKIRLRPGYFPFVEPGFELDIWFQDRWLELLPCGLVHPRVLHYGGINPTKWQAFAFGLGLSRLVMTRYKIEDIRLLQGCDVRFLRQFR